MEEIYVIKMKGLPTAPVSVKSERSRVHEKDLGREALLGLGLFQNFFGLISVIFCSIDLIHHWYNVFGILSGLIYVTTGGVGIFASYRRKRKFIGSNRFIKMFLFGSLLSLLTSFTCISLVAFGVWTVSANTHPTRSMVILSKIFESAFAALSVFTSSRILWPTRLQCCAKTWPQKSNIKQKMIIATTIFARGLESSNDYRRYLGPNCVVSLAVPEQQQQQSAIQSAETPNGYVGRAENGLCYNSVVASAADADAEVHPSNGVQLPH